MVGRLSLLDDIVGISVTVLCVAIMDVASYCYATLYVAPASGATEMCVGPGFPPLDVGPVFCHVVELVDGSLLLGYTHFQILTRFCPMHRLYLFCLLKMMPLALGCGELGLGGVPHLQPHVWRIFASAGNRVTH